ncbi:hypothetical protein EVB91_189 [Rhizobium phage RHph_I1_18]|nr:hypothetical protein EVB91_189 [Rhizobium phage RHph_I1_18]
MRPYKLFNGHHVDLDHILTVSQAYFDDQMGHGGYFVGFSIQFMFRNEPIRYVVGVEWFVKEERDTFLGRYPVRRVKFASTEHRDWEIANALPVLQKEVDKLIEAWSAR